jgi:choline dehydrogenase
MGTDALAVVAPDTHVHGIQGLRVVDSSIFPTITNGNLNSPTIMLAERAADLIKGKGMLPAAGVDVYIDPEYQSRQRVGQPQRT